MDHRSDIYSLGMVLAEMLTGHRPFEQSGSYSALPLQIEAMAVERSQCDRLGSSGSSGSFLGHGEHRPQVPRGRRDRSIPAGASQLADDLRRLLEDRPLKHAPELSRVERARKFARRHPRLASSATVAAAAALVLLAVGSALAAARSQLADSRSRDLIRDHDAGVTKALCLVNTRLDLQDHLRRGIAACERTLALFGAPRTRTGPDIRPGCGSARKIADGSPKIGASCSCSSPPDECDCRRARSKPLATPWTSSTEPSRFPACPLPGLYGSTGPVTGRCKAMRDWPPGPVVKPSKSPPRPLEITIWSPRRWPAGADRKGSVRPSSNWTKPCKLNPRHYWSLVQRGICRLNGGDLVGASSDFGQCTGIWPEFAWGYFNRGCVLDRAGNKAAAVLDYTAAIARDPGLVPAYVNRGLARLELKQHAAALADFDRASPWAEGTRSYPPGVVSPWKDWGGTTRPMTHFGTASIMSTACRPRHARVCPGPTGLPSPPAIPAGLARHSTTSCGTTLATSRRYTGAACSPWPEAKKRRALGDFDRAIAADPMRIEARRYRAILLARRGDWDAAAREINGCLEREPRSPATLYAAACVAARAYGKAGTTALANQSIDLLERALAEGADAAQADKDPDFEAVRTLAQFRRLADRSRTRN